MSIEIGHQLTGYDRQTDVLALTFDIDADKFERIKAIADVDDDDPDAAGSYPLNDIQLQAVADVLGKEFDSTRFEFFLEPVAGPRLGTSG